MNTNYIVTREQLNGAFYVIEANKDLLDDRLDEFLAFCYINLETQLFCIIIKILISCGIQLPETKDLMNEILNERSFVNTAILDHFIAEAEKLRLPQI